jgi:hypothetical protein
MLNSSISLDVLDWRIASTVAKSVRFAQKEHLHQKGCLGQSLASDELPVGIHFSSPRKRWKKFLSYLVIYHYFPLEPSVLVYLHLDLQDLMESEDSQYYWMSVLIENKQRFLKYLQDQELMTEQQWFSGICNETYLLKTLKSISIQFEEKLRRPKRVVRRKGYRDKGSLGDSSISAIRQEMQSDVWLSLLQYELEEQQKLKQLESRLLVSYLDEGRVLTDELLVKFKLRKEGINNESERESCKETCSECRETG